MASLVPVSDAASQLGLSERRVRSLIGAGQLRAERVGRSWLISPHELERFGRRPRRDGRPLNARNAWALLALLAGKKPEWVERSSLSRLRRYARDPDGLLSAIEHSEPRSDVLSLWVSEDDLAKLGEYPLVRSGLSARRALSQLDVIRRLEEPLDAYTSADVARQIVKRFAPQQNVEDPNVILRVPKLADVLSENEEVPLPIVAADLLGHEDSRVRRAAESALRRLALDS